ncbi:hypothetical protein EV356DRAFT_111491 [Viridothelium virens]|uniref:Uncharacterized protein n=1 Tax=Viridothelium virens TaxID=1048519 RepID=A0A6A6HC13_VIRVR|nr:hypothetical protein EV356DRAFT_111491 [Viridothelium virens]
MPNTYSIMTEISLQQKETAQSHVVSTSRQPVISFIASFNSKLWSTKVLPHFPDSTTELSPQKSATQQHRLVFAPLGHFTKLRIPGRSGGLFVQCLTAAARKTSGFERSPQAALHFHAFVSTLNLHAKRLASCHNVSDSMAMQRMEYAQHKEPSSKRHRSASPSLRSPKRILDMVSHGRMAGTRSCGGLAHPPP